MGFPDDLLADDERVVLNLHPHWKELFFPVLAFIVSIGGGAFLIAVGPDYSWLQLGIAGAALVLVVIFTVWPFIKWVTTHFVLTTHRVMIRQGVFTRTGRDVPLVRVNDVSFEHTLLERVFLKCGTLIVESAGEHGQVVLKDIPRVEKVQSTLYQLVEQFAERRAAGPGYYDTEH